MSQIEQSIRRTLLSFPEISRSAQHKLINRRSLARFLIKEGAAKPSEFEAVVATLRRIEFEQVHDQSITPLLSKMVVRIKERITIVDLKKTKRTLMQLKGVIDAIRYDEGDTFKMVVGTASIKVIVDQDNKDVHKVISEISEGQIKKLIAAEISLRFPDDAGTTKGVIAAISAQFAIHGILIEEMVTATPELMIYTRQEDGIRAYHALKDLQKG